MKNILSSLCAILLIGVLQGQNRYPYVQSPTEMSVKIAWNTSQSESSILNYGSSSTSLNQNLTDVLPKTKHVFEIVGLLPDTKYYYQVVSTSMNTNIEHFTTAKPDVNTSFSFLHYGDCGYDNSVQNSIATLMEAEDADFGLVAGDVDQGTGNDYDDVFFGVYKDMLKHKCHFTVIGNHDTYHDNAATYLDEFHLPSNNPINTERYYSFTWGNAKFIGLDSNIPYTVGTPQHDWLIDEMACNDRQWLFVFFHHPPWTNAWDISYYIPFQQYFEYEGNEDMRTDLVPFFEQFNVDFVLNGHSHCYQRGDLNDVKYVISGGAGSSTIDINTNSNSPNIDTEIYTNQYVVFEVKGDSIVYKSIDINGNLIDSVFTTKSYIAYQATPNYTDATCAGNDGTVSITVQGPKTPYQIVWSTGATTSMIDGLTSGSYTVSITDANDCSTDIQTIVVGADTPITTSFSETEPTCEGMDNGTIAATTQGGSGIYEFNWSNGATTSMIDNLGAGSYEVTISDGNCQQIETINLEYSVTINPEITSNTGMNSFCEGTTIELSADGNYSSYNWSNGLSGQTVLISTPGSYSVTATDENGCQGASSSLTITQDSLPIALFQFSVNGQEVMFTDLSMNGSVYNWEFGDGTSSTTQNPALHTYVLDGIYTVVLTVENNCGIVTFSETIAIMAQTSIIDPENNPLQIKLTPNPIIEMATLTFMSEIGKAYDILIVDVNGRVLNKYENIKNGNLEIGSEHFLPGTYFYQLTDGTDSYTGKMVVH